MSYKNKRYTFWTASDTIEWIISLNPSRYQKYRDILTDSFQSNGFTGASIIDLDREDLKSYGIINLNDRKTIYKSIITLIATQKRRDSQIIEPISLSDDEDTTDLNTSSPRDYRTLLTTKQHAQLLGDGYCIMEDETEDSLLVDLVSGWLRCNHNGYGITTEIVNAIVYFHGAKYDNDEYVQVKSGGDEATVFLTRKVNLSLSNLLRDQPGDTLNCPQVPSESLANVLRYLAHHKGIEPDPLPCPVRSIHMQQIVSDKWDATYIDSYDKKSIFEIILAANYMDIKCLVHLGAAKIATLIKQLDQNEINRIIEEEEQYRREQAQKTENDESRFGLNDNEEP